jgi:hypothetical protein
VEVIDFKTGALCPRPDNVRLDAAAGIHRLILGGMTPARPIHTTQLHLPSATPMTVELTDDEVLAAWNDVLDARDEILQALESDDFPARPGPHCASCQHRSSCPDAGKLS